MLKRLLFATIILTLAVMPLTVLAQESGPVQEQTGTIRTGDFFYYLVPDLKRGQTLYLYAENRSGNLDPIMGILDAAQDTEALEIDYSTEIQTRIEQGEDPMLAAEAARDKYFLAWDDDSGDGLAAALAFPVTESGDYRLMIAGSLSNLGRRSFGGYRLLAGIDVPETLDGTATPTGDVVAILDQEASPVGVAVEERTGSLSAGEPTTFYQLRDVQPGDTIYAYLETTSGDLLPSLVLRNYALKPVRAVNLNGSQTATSLQYTVDDLGRNYRLEIEACCGDEIGEGSYRLLVGVNEPDVLSGRTPSTSQPVVMTAIPVAVGVKLQQIVAVEQASEYFTAVASLQMEWDDPSLAFDPGECECTFKSYTDKTFNQFIEATNGRWPDFTLFNQQGNRWSQNRVGIIFENGHAIYFERFTTNLQVDFDFEQYPFDTQEFTIRVDSIFPETMFYFTDLEGFTTIDPNHGEDEFIIDEWETTINSEQASTQSKTSSFVMSFTAPRHLAYYVLQIFAPILLIIAVSWVTFFLKDYGRRIEVASANLLLFIAFSFSLSDNYPRLGYVTFLDAVMAVMFIVNALVIVYNVWMKRIEMRGGMDRAEKIDDILDYLYPVLYVVALILLYIAFF